MSLLAYKAQNLTLTLGSCKADCKKGPATLQLALVYQQTRKFITSDLTPLSLCSLPVLLALRRDPDAADEPAASAGERPPVRVRAAAAHLPLAARLLRHDVAHGGAARLLQGVSYHHYIRIFDWIH